MKTENDVNLMTVGELLDALKKYEKKHWDDSVVAWNDDYTLGVVGMGLDSDGDLRIEVETVEDGVLEGIWTVNDVMTSLEGKPRGARAYIAINGYYLAIDSKGGVFSESDDDDVIGCHADIIGEYEVPKPREEAEPQKPNREEQIMKIVLWVLFLGTLAFLGYKIYAMIAHTGDSLWESILWIVVCLIVLTVSGLTLFYSKEE